MKSRRWLLLVVLVIVVAGGATAAWFLWPRPKFDFDQLGGTVLIYEIAPNADADDPFDPVSDMNILVEQLKRRVDPDNRDEATVRPAGEGRVEIRIARTKDDHAEHVKRVKSLIGEQGRLEFRMLANSLDDKEAIALAKEWINTFAVGEELGNLQRDGMPPPAPGSEDGKRFKVRVADGQISVVTYSWVELGPHERKFLDLDSAAERDPERNAAWTEAKNRRGLAITLPGRFFEKVLMQGALFYSRECKNRKLSEQERKEKAVDYFVLARDPEFDPENPELRTPRIDGSYFVNVFTRPADDLPPAIYFKFNASGGKLFGNLTRRNVSTGLGPDDQKSRRNLAIILDGQVISAPTINSEIREGGMISGNFTQQEVDQLAAILRSGALPARLKAAPVSEMEVAPKN